MARLYVHVVRPGLVAMGATTASDELASPERLALSSARAMLAALAAKPVAGELQYGDGRAALVSVGRRPLEELDGQVISDVLTGDGWSTTEVVAGAPAHEVAGKAEEGHVELVVMPTSRAADLLASASAYTALRRLPDPPLIVACSLGERDDERRARAAGADTFVSDVEDLLAYVWAWLPGRGQRHWGVRMRRLSDTLIVEPTGQLDPSSVLRLRQVVASRTGSYGGLVVDARSLARVTVEGLDALLAWLDEPAPDGAVRHPRMVAGGEMTDALRMWDRPNAASMLMDATGIAETR